MGRSQLRTQPDRLLELLNRFRPLALAFQGQAQVVVGRGEVGVDLQGLPAVVGGLVPPAH